MTQIPAIITQPLAMLVAASHIFIGLTLLLLSASFFSGKLRDLLQKITLGRQFILWCAFIVALVSTAGSLYYSEIAMYEPCKLCWFQ